MSTAAGSPTSLSEITPQWLTGILGRTTPGVEVAEVTVDSVVWGTATKVMLKVRYAANPPGGPPEALCLKGGFDDALRALGHRGYRAEARFYADIAPALGDVVPRCWGTEVDDGEGQGGEQGLVVLDDLRGPGVAFGRPQDRYTPDQVAAALELLADMHGRSWDRTGPGATPWLVVGSPQYRTVVTGFLSEAHWAAAMERPTTDSFTPAMRDRRRVERAMHRLWEIDDAEVQSLAHGDPHIGNTYLVDGVIRFLDWQVACLGPWSDDTAYFLVGALDVETRRACERDLLQTYLAALAATGAPAPTFDEAWAAYRRHHLHGLLFAVCPPEKQGEDVCRLMGERYAAAVADHDTLAALGQ
ncbi:phosphotransferase [Pseudonocardia yuanmonensis]|uniref:Phosphotransferase n=1 Tax=Pseudonocardia yuanmonensis TaxID=1095914 RepID=A0ABP8XPS8_9PSEU